MQVLECFKGGLRKIVTLVCVLWVAVCVATSVSHAQISQASTTEITTPTDERILGLLDVGNNMLVDGRNAQANSHFETFALQFPGNGPLMQGWALAARAADEVDDLVEKTKSWDGEANRPSPEIAEFMRSYLALFALDTAGDQEDVAEELASVRSRILQSGLNVDSSSSLQLLLAMMALRDDGNPDISASETLNQASQWVSNAAELDPRDPTVRRLNRVVDYLVRAQELVDLGRPLSNQEVAEAELEFGAIESSFLPGAIRQRSTVLIQALVLRQDRNADMPREYLRGLGNVIALSELGEEGAENAATTWEEATKIEPFRRSASFQEYGSYLGRYMSCYVDENAGLNLLSRVEGLQFDQSQNLSTEEGRLAAERRLETLTLLWRFATRMRLNEEARGFRGDALALAERLADRERKDLINGPWLQPLWIGGLAIIVLALLFLVIRFYAGRGKRANDTNRRDGDASSRAESQLRAQIVGVHARLVLRRTVWSLIFASIAVLAVCLAALAGLFAAWAWNNDLYMSVYNYTHTWSVGVTVGVSVFVIGLIVAWIRSGGANADTLAVASAVDSQLGLGGVAETVFGIKQISAVSGRDASDVAGNQYLYTQLPAAVQSVKPRRLVGLVVPFLLLGLTMGLGGVAAAAYQFLPVPTFAAVELPSPAICPPPNQQQNPAPPPVQMTQPQNNGGGGDGATGLDVTNSRVPEDQIEELEFQLGVGGTDDVGEPFDYHTTLPSREFDVDRRDDPANGLGQAEEVPDGFAGAGRQTIPDRFLGL